MSRNQKVLVLMVGALLFGCGGGGSKNSEPAAPISIESTPRKADDSGWTRYRIGETITIGRVAITIREMSFPITGDPEGQIQFDIIVANKSDTKLLPFRPWSNASRLFNPSLKDEHGNTYKLFVRNLDSTDVHPGKSVIEELRFTKPVSAARTGYLTLPADGCGLESDLKIKFSLLTGKLREANIPELTKKATPEETFQAAMETSKKTHRPIVAKKGANPLVQKYAETFNKAQLLLHTFEALEENALQAAANLAKKELEQAETDHQSAKDALIMAKEKAIADATVKAKQEAAKKVPQPKEGSVDELSQARAKLAREEFRLLAAMKESIEEEYRIPQ